MESVTLFKRFNEGKEGNLQNHKMTFCRVAVKEKVMTLILIKSRKRVLKTMAIIFKTSFMFW